MEKKLVELKTGNRTILVEGALSEKTGKVVQAGGINDKITKKFDDLMEIIEPIADSIVKSINSLIEKPSSMTTEFGLSFTAEGNVFVVKASGEASFKVTLTWNKDKNT